MAKGKKRNGKKRPSFEILKEAVILWSRRQIAWLREKLRFIVGLSGVSDK